jgi:hypothetical protein
MDAVFRIFLTGMACAGLGVLAAILILVAVIFLCRKKGGGAKAEHEVRDSARL